MSSTVSYPVRPFPHQGSIWWKEFRFSLLVCNFSHLCNKYDLSKKIDWQFGHRNRVSDVIEFLIWNPRFLKAQRKLKSHADGLIFRVVCNIGEWNGSVVIWVWNFARSTYPLSLSNFLCVYLFRKFELSLPHAQWEKWIGINVVSKAKHFDYCLLFKAAFSCLDYVRSV